MLDIKMIEGEKSEVIENLEKRGFEPSIVHTILSLNEERKMLIQGVESKKASINALSREIGERKKKKENADEKIQDIQKALELQIEKFETKTSLIKHRRKFLVTKLHLEEFISHQGSDFDEFLDDSTKKVVFTDNTRYASDSAISISNSLLVREFAEFLIKKIDDKILELEKAIIA